MSVDILRKWFESGLDLNCVIESVSYNSSLNQSTLVLDDILHIRNDMVVTISNVDFKVISSDESSNSIVLPGDLTGETNLTVEPLFFVNGTPLKVNGDNIHTPLDVKYPMVYVYELLREVVHRDNSPYLITAPGLRMFLLDDSNLNEWSQSDHLEKRVRGINRLFNRIVRDLKNDGCCFYTEETDIERIVEVNWGRYVDSKGHTKTIFNENTSGIEIKFDLVIFKNCNIL